MFASVVAIALLAQSPSALAWRTVFTGRPDFEHCTRVYSVKRGVLFFDSTPITATDGGDVYLLRDGSDKPTKVFSVQEQGSLRIVRIGDQLLIPGIDAMEDWSYGNYYLSESEGETWHKVRNIPNGIHVFDMCSWRRKWYVGFAQEGGAAVYESSDEGKTWNVSLQVKPKGSFGETLMVLPLRDGLYAHVVREWGTVEQDADFYKFDGIQWKPLKLFKDKGACWNYRLDHGAAWLGQGTYPFFFYEGKLKRIDSLEGKAMTDFEFPNSDTVLAVGKDPGKNASSLYAARRSSFEQFGPFKWIADLPAGCIGNSLAIHDGTLFCACYAPKGGKILTVPLEDVLARVSQ